MGGQGATVLPLIVPIIAVRFVTDKGQAPNRAGALADELGRPGSVEPGILAEIAFLKEEPNMQMLRGVIAGIAVTIEISDSHPVGAAGVEGDGRGEGPCRGLHEQRHIEIRRYEVRQPIPVHVGDGRLRGAGTVQ